MFTDCVRLLCWTLSISTKDYTRFARSVIKQRLSHVQDRLDDRAAALAAGDRGLVTWRSSILEDLAHLAMPAVTHEKVCTAYHHANTLLCALPFDRRVLD